MEQLTHDQLRQRVNQIMCQLFEFEPAELSPEKNLFSDLDLDSLDAIDLVISFQREFKFKPENSELQQIRHVSDIHELVIRHYDRNVSH